jgi:hypothetical protein
MRALLFVLIFSFLENFDAVPLLLLMIVKSAIIKISRSSKSNSRDRKSGRLKDKATVFAYLLNKIFSTY